MHVASKVLQLDLTFDILLSTIMTLLSYQLLQNTYTLIFQPFFLFPVWLGAQQGDRHHEHCSCSTEVTPLCMQLLFWQG